MRIPHPRGPLTDELFSALRTGPDGVGTILERQTPAPEDAALALWTLHELHHRGIDDVADDLEWHPELIRVRRSLEQDLEQRLRSRFKPPEGLSFVADVFGWVEEQDGVSLADHVHRDADREQVLDLLRVKSLYHLKEADPFTWVIPRLGVRAKAGLVELQYDEYGGGDPNRLHHHLFARGMEACGLTPSYDDNVELAPVEILEQNNAVTMFALHRRLRGAALGHLAAFEATSSMPSRRMAEGLRRLEFPEEMAAYYDEHVEADAVHEQLAVRTICAALLDEEPELEDDLWFGAFTCLDLEDRAARALLAGWGVQEKAA